MSKYFIPPHIRQALTAALEARGIDVTSLLSDFAPFQAIDSPRYDLLVCQRLLQAGWYLLDDEDLGLGDGPPLKPGAFFYASNLMINAPNLGEALRVAACFYGYVGKSWEPEFFNDKKQACFRIQRNSRLNDPNHLLADYLLIGFYQFASWLIGGRIALKSVSFDYPRPEYEVEFQTLFPCRRYFDCDYLEFTFSATYLKQKIVQNAGSLAALLLSSPSFILTPQDNMRSFHTEVRHLLETWPSPEMPSFADVSERFNLTPKMLGTRLRKEDVNFNEIKKSVRLDKATQLLTNHNISIAKIAEQLGFEETAAFSKAFKAWVGESPAQYRKKWSSLSE